MAPNGSSTSLKKTAHSAPLCARHARPCQRFYATNQTFLLLTKPLLVEKKGIQRFCVRDMRGHVSVDRCTHPFT